MVQLRRDTRRGPRRAGTWPDQLNPVELRPEAPARAAAGAGCRSRSRSSTLLAERGRPHLAVDPHRLPARLRHQALPARAPAAERVRALARHDRPPRRDGRHPLRVRVQEAHPLAPDPVPAAVRARRRRGPRAGCPSPRRPRSSGRAPAPPRRPGRARRSPARRRRRRAAARVAIRPLPPGRLPALADVDGADRGFLRELVQHLAHHLVHKALVMPEIVEEDLAPCK